MSYMNNVLFSLLFQRIGQREWLLSSLLSNQFSFKSPFIYILLHTDSIFTPFNECFLSHSGSGFYYVLTTLSKKVRA